VGAGGAQHTPMSSVTLVSQEERQQLIDQVYVCVPALSCIATWLMCALDVSSCTELVRVSGEKDMEKVQNSTAKFELGKYQASQTMVRAPLLRPSSDLNYAAETT
jgi:hypothetical protein